MLLETAPVEHESDAAWIVGAEDLREGRIEERLEVALDGSLDEAGIEQGREDVGRREAHRRADDEPRRRYPSPRRLLARPQMPGGGDVVLGSPRLGDHLSAHQ